MNNLLNPYRLKAEAISTDFIFEVTTTSAGQNITLPLINGYTYNFTVNYGDGGGDKTVTAYNDGDRINVYSTAGIYTVTMSGVCGAFDFFTSGITGNWLTGINNWGELSMQVLNFYNTSLASLPTNGSKIESSITTVTRLFMSTDIVSVPSGIFDNLSSPTDFLYLFADCFLLETIPSGIFDGCVGALSFNTSFGNCYVLASLPSGMFDQCTSVTNFNACFASCYALSEIPENLFYYNSAVTIYSGVFYQCRNLSLPSSIWNLSNLSIVTGFTVSFYCTQTSYSHTGTVQDVWNYCTPSTTADCFQNCTALTNYASIPAGWK